MTDLLLNNVYHNNDVLELLQIAIHMLYKIEVLL